MGLVGVSASSPFTHCWFVPLKLVGILSPCLERRKGMLTVSLISKGTWGLTEGFLTKIWVRDQGLEMVS